MSRLPSVVDAVTPLPVVAARGIADGHRPGEGDIVGATKSVVRLSVVNRRRKRRFRRRHQSNVDVVRPGRGSGPMRTASR